MMGEGSTERLRLFIAISVPEEIRMEIGRTQDELRRMVPADCARWTKPDQFHLTLRFLGDVPVESVTALKEAVNAVCGGDPALRLRAQGVGFFPNARSPRVVWAGVNDGEGRLVDLQRRIEGAVRQFAEEAGTERFAGHVTLGRFRHLKQHEIEKLAAQALTVKDRVFGEWTAEGVEIYRSELAPTGARHTCLAIARFGE
jgi:2'-5' RNA ligase